MLEKDEIETEKFRQEILKRHRHLFDLNKSLFQLADAMINTDTMREDAPLHVVIAFLFGKACKTFQAVDILCQRGYGQDAAILARSLFEILVNARCLAKGNDTLADKFRNFDCVQIYKCITKLPHLLTTERKEEITSMYQKVTPLYADNKRKDYWSGKSISEMAKEVGLHEKYVLWYQLILSSRVHSNALSVNDYISCEKESLVVEYGPNEKFIKEVVIISSWCFLYILNSVNQTFHIGLNSRIEETEKLLHQKMV